MARAVSPLTERRIRQTRAVDKPLKLADGGGMYLLVRPDGSRYWRLDYRFGGKRKTLALGVYPQVTLAEARKLRADARAHLAEGRDPGALKKAGKLNRPIVVGDEQAYALAIIGEGVWDWVLASGIVRHDVQWSRMMGIDAGCYEHSWEEALAPLYEEEREELMAAIQRCLAGEAGFVYEHRIRHADGKDIWVQNRGEVVGRDARGKPLRMVGSLRDITEERREALRVRRRNQLLQTIAAINELLMSELSDQALMARICEELVHGDLYAMAWIGMVADDGVTVRPVAACGDSSDYLADVQIRSDDSPAGCGPTGKAIRTGVTVINDDSRTQASFAPWRVRALERGYLASASTPVRVNGRVLGALNVYAAEANVFVPETVLLLEKLAADLGVAIAQRSALAALRESEERFRMLLDASPEAIFGVDTQGVCTFVNPACLRMLGYTQEEMLGKSVHPLIHHTHADGSPYPKEECRLRRSTREGQSTHVDTEVHWRKDGTCFPIEYWSHPMYRNGELIGAVVNFIDISERKRAETALRESEARFRAMAEHSADWIWAVGVDGRPTYSNQRGVENLGYTVEEFLGMDVAALLHPDDQPRYREIFEKAVAGGKGWRNVELRWRHRNGSYRSLESSASALFDETGRLTGFQGIDRDITERRQAEARIEFLAHHDALTGLPNRVLLRDRFEHAVAVAERAQSRVALLFLDLDNFKVVNDTLGHAAGDELLLAVVKRLQGAMRDSDTVSRQGGDEFILLMNDVPNVERVESLASKLLGKLADPIEITGHVLNASCSIGIAVYPEDGKTFDGLLQKADAAMYNAKEAGRNTYRFFDEQMNLQAHEHLLLQNRLYQALFRAEFHLAFQPQVDIASGRIIGLEALLRWNSPDLGDVTPNRFIPVAESSGLIVPIGAWVMEEACRQAQALRQSGWPELIMGVNLSALQFRRTGLVETVAGALERTGLPPHLLELELTESILLHDVENNLETVRQLKALGVRLSIDDFGTGYSSLSYLKRFAVDKLKIDRSFVRDIGTDPDDAAIVRAVIQLAKSLRLDTIAEGVETEEQLAFLREEGCQEVQGFLFSPPLPLAALKAFLAERVARPASAATP